MEKGIKDEIKKYYGGIAGKAASGNAEGQCCCKPKKGDVLYADEYLEGLPEEALKASVGCANPVFLAIYPKGGNGTRSGQRRRYRCFDFREVCG